MYTSTELLNMHRDHLVEVCMKFQYNADRIQDNIVQLQRELTEAREAKKVALPKEVADAFDFFKSEGADGDDILRWVEYRTDGKHMDKIRGYIRDGKGFDIAVAIANGYTVVEPPTMEDKIEAKLEKLLNENNVGNVVPVRELAVLLTLAVRQVLAEDRKEEE